jgi:hypothetical protein
MYVHSFQSQFTTSTAGTQNPTKRFLSAYNDAGTEIQSTFIIAFAIKFAITITNSRQLWKETVAQLLKKPAFVFTWARHWTISSAR